MHLHDLPDDCLIEIYDRISIRALLIGRMVCSRWNVVITHDVCPRRNRLALLNHCSIRYRCLSKREATFGQIDHFDLLTQYADWPPSSVSWHRKDIPFRDLILNDKSCSLLTTLFPNIRYFTFVDICAVERPLKRYLSRMFQAWAQTLSHVKLLSSQTLSPDVLRSLSKLPHLTHLTTDVSLVRLDNFGIVPKLRQLWFVDANSWEGNSCQQVGAVLEKVPSYGILNLNCDNMHSMVCGEFMAASSGLTRLHLREPVDITLLDEITSMFTAISSLHIYISSGDILEAFYYLTRLNNLTDLSIKISKFDPNSAIDFPSSLPSVKRAHLQFHLSPHRIAQLKSIFPNATRVTFSVKSKWFNRYLKLLCDPKDVAAKPQCDPCRYLQTVIYKHFNRSGSRLLFGVDSAGHIRDYSLVQDGSQENWFFELVHI